MYQQLNVLPGKVWIWRYAFWPQISCLHHWGTCFYGWDMQLSETTVIIDKLYILHNVLDAVSWSHTSVLSVTWFCDFFFFFLLSWKPFLLGCNWKSRWKVFYDPNIPSSSLSSWDMIVLNISWCYGMIHWLMLLMQLVNVNLQMAPLSFLWGQSYWKRQNPCPKCSNPKYMQTLPMSPGRTNFSVLNYCLAWFFDIDGHFDSMVATLMIYMERGCMQIHAQYMC